MGNYFEQFLFTNDFQGFRIGPKPFSHSWAPEGFKSIKNILKARNSWIWGTNKISSLFPRNRGFQDVFDEISSLGRPAIEKGFQGNTKALKNVVKKELSI